MTATTRFDPNTPPSFAEDIAEELSDHESPDLLSASAVQRGNRLAMTDAAEREARLIVGTTQAGARERDLRLAEDRATAERQRAESEAAKGGPTITTALRGKVGAAVRELLALQKIDAAYSKVTERVRGEVETIDEEKRAEARILGGLLDAALDAARAKHKTPDVLAPFINWIEHQRPVGRPEGFAVTVFASLNERHAAERTQRVRECLGEAGEAGKLLSSRTLSILDRTGHAADMLDSAGLSVDATADDVVDSNDPAVLTAWREWKSIVQEWSDVQSTRRWIAVALSRGFDPKKPLELLNDTDAEMVSWRTQFVGSEVGVQGSHQALKYWLERVRPRP
ncbi:MAG: hypothetical protein WBB62_10915 [Rhodococcus sp. (in: high G+C Gram-positive bacteria)]